MDRLSQMEAFVRVIETGSFSAAGRQLQVGQPAISKTIGHLEARLGVQLLLRTSRGLAPTEAGTRFYERAKRVLAEADDADRTAQGAAATMTGRLRVSAPVTFARLHVVPALAGFLEAHPALEIELVLDDAVIDLVEQGIDVGLRMGSLPDSTLVAARLGRCRRLVVAAPAYLARRGVPETPAALLDHDVVIHSLAGLGTVWAFTRGGAETSVNIKGRVRITSGEGVREAVLAGLGLAIGSEWMYTQELARGVVRPLLTEWSLPPLDLWSVHPGGRRVSAKAKAFVAFVRTLLSTSADGAAPA